MKINKMPTTKALLVFSWLIAILGLALGGYLIIFKFNEANLVISGVAILLGSLLLATAIRMFANTGQMIFDLKYFLFNNLQSLIQALNQNLNTQLQTLNQDLNTQLQSLNQDLNTQLQSLNQDLNTQLQSLNQGLNTQLQSISNNCEQINCDSKDISQNMHRIKTFFEQIERHLDLKK